MTDFEKAEKLREKADISFAEAKEALDKNGGDILDAMIYLERQGKSTIPAGGGYFSGVGTTALKNQDAYGGEDSRESDKSGGESFSDTMKRFGRFCMKVLTMGVTNFLDAAKGGDLIFSCPMIAVVFLLVFFFWITVPLFILSLFFGFRYRFRGPDLDRDSVNSVMDSATDVAEDVKKSFKEHKNANCDTCDDGE